MVSFLSLLLIPLIAMQFSTEVNWSPFDFAVMGIMLSTLGIALEVILRIFPKKSQRIWLIAIIFLFFLLVWAELAVGVFGTILSGN